jgi:FkbM family methyltransferase
MSRWPDALIREPVRHAKPLVGQLLSSPALGVLISSATRNRIRNKGVRIDTSPAAFTAVVKAQLAFGIYESAEIRFIRQYLSGWSRVLELGASLGVTAAHILDVAAPGAEVVCVEANPHLLPALRATTAAAAKPGTRVTTVHGAVPPGPPAGSGSVELRLGGSHLASRAGPGAGGKPGRRLRVPAVDISELVRGWTGYALVCDIEGAEADLIASAHPVLTGASRVVIELHETTYTDTAVTVPELREALLGLGFRLMDSRGRVLVLDGPAAPGTAHRLPRGRIAQEKKAGEHCG